MKVYVITNRSFNQYEGEFVPEDQYDTYVIADKGKAREKYLGLKASLTGFYYDMDMEFDHNDCDGMMTIWNEKYITKLMIEEVDLG